MAAFTLTLILPEGLRRESRRDPPSLQLSRDAALGNAVLVHRLQSAVSTADLFAAIRLLRDGGGYDPFLPW